MCDVIIQSVPSKDSKALSRSAMGPVHLVPQWKDLKSQIKEKLKTRKGAPEATEGVMLSDRPSILFRLSCCPNLMPLICFYSSSSTSCFASFTWRSTKSCKTKVHVWIYSAEAEPPVAEKDYTMEEDPKVLLITHVPSWNLFVTYCNDLHLRIFGDHTQDLRLLSDTRSPYSITSMCYNPEMCELVTGAIGMLAFWTFGTGEVPSLSVIQTVSILSGEFVHFLSVESERKVLVALCENMILIFDYHSKVKKHAFQVSQGVSLTCCAASWQYSFLYAGDLAGDVKVWNFDTGSQINQFTAHLSAIISLVSRVSMHTFMTASLDGLMKEWDLTTCELLRRVDIGEQVFQMQFISEQTFFLRTQYTFSIRTINNFYQLFNRPNSVLRKLVRIECGPEKARLMAVTEDGVVHFLSPVTGEMLFVTWPFKLVEKALDYVYDPDREELLVTMGTADIYALDTTRNPCPCKYILRATDSKDDRVLCLAYCRLDLGGRTSSFIFSGYKSGRVHTATRHLYQMGSRRIHDGNVLALSSLSDSGNQSSQSSRESSFLCSYGSDQYIILSDLVLRKNTFLELEPLVCIPSTQYRINHLLLIPGYICVLTEQNRVRLWRQAALVPGKKNPVWKETSAMHSSSITSFDYCHRLSMLVTAGSDGSVRLWDILGQMLVEFDTSLRFSRVCFANQRGDLVVGCNKNIYFISCVAYLPTKHLSRLAAQHVRDDVIERPLPFLPHFLLHFDIVFVPRYHQMIKHVMEFERLEPISNPQEVMLEKGLVIVREQATPDASAPPLPDFYGLPPATREALLGVRSKHQLLPQPSFWHTPEKKSLPGEGPLPQPERRLPALPTSVPLWLRVPFQTGHSWPIAPDGYIPNSVIRARLFPKGAPDALESCSWKSRQALPQRHLVRIPWEEIQMPENAPPEQVQKKKLRKPRKARSERRLDLLADIVSKPWLRHKPSEMTLPSVVKTILELMDDVPFSTYLMCTAALVQLAESYTLTSEVQDQAFERLMRDTSHKEVRMRVAAWEALGKMDLLDGKDVVPLAKALLDDNQRVRDLARSLLDSVAGITDKFALKKEVFRLAKFSLEDLTLTEPTDIVFPCRMRIAGVIAESKCDAVNALMDVSHKLVKLMENQLTANLFLVADKPLEDSQDYQPISWRRMGSAAQGTDEMVAEYSEPEAPVEAKARWLGLFDIAETKSPGAIEAAKRRLAEKVPKIPSGSKESTSAAMLRAELMSESGTSTTSSSTSTSSTGSTGSSAWQEVRRQKRQLKARHDRHGAKPAGSPAQEAPKPTKSKLVQPIPLRRRDTRMQLYTEMLKRQPTQSKKEQPAAPPPAPKQESPGAPGKLSVPPQKGPRGSLIDPKREYSTDKSKWRSDLYKLLMLRIGPYVEGRTVTEDLLASAQMALGGRAMSWELFTSIGQSLLATQDKTDAEPTKLMQYMAELFKTSPWEMWPEAAVESKEQVVAIKMGREIHGTSESETESSSLEDMPQVQEEEPAAEGVGTPTATVLGKKLKAGFKQRWKKATIFTSLRRKVPGEKEETEEEEEEEEEEEQQQQQQPEKEYKVVSGKGWETVRRKAQELLRGQEEDLVKGKVGELAKAKEQKLDKEKEQEAGKQRDWEEDERRDRERARRAAAKWPRRGGARIKEEESWKDSEEERVLAKAAEWILSEGMTEALAGDQNTLISELMDKILAEAQEMALAELREEARAVARARLLAELRERAQTEARKNVLGELREKAMAEARERVLAEVKESALAEARERVLAEVKEKAMAEFREIALAEGLEGEQLEARVQQLAEERLKEITEAKLRELAEMWLKKVGEESIAEEGAAEQAEAKVAELAEEEVGKLTEAQLAELTEAKLEELATVREEELAEARIWELAGAWIKARAQARASELAEKKLRELAMKKRAQRPDRGKMLTTEKKEAEIWEETGKEDVVPISAADREVLMAALQEDRAQRTELTHSAHAQLLLDILTKPEMLEQDSECRLLVRLFQVVSLLKIPSGLTCKGLAGFLLSKAEEVAKTGEEEDKRSDKEISPVYVALRNAVEALEPQIVDTRGFSIKLQALLRVARAMLRARALKEQLERGFQEPAWWEKAMKDWLEDKRKGIGRKAWGNLREAIKWWQFEQRRAEREEMKARHLRLVAQPFQLREGTWEERGEQKPMERGEEEQALATPEQLAQPQGEQPKPIVWALNERVPKAREAILNLEEPSPSPVERYRPPRPNRQRLPMGSLYLPTELPRICQSKIRAGMKQRILRLPEKAVDWEMFSVLYQSLLSLKEEEGGVESAVWHKQFCSLLDLYGLKNPTIRALVQELLTDTRRPHKAIPGKDLQMREAEADLGERILYHVATRPACFFPSLPTLHGVIPLSYQNNVHTFQPVGVTCFGTLCLKWKTVSGKGAVPKLCLYDHPQHHSK